MHLCVKFQLPNSQKKREINFTNLFTIKFAVQEIFLYFQTQDASMCQTSASQLS